MKYMFCNFINKILNIKQLFYLNMSLFTGLFNPNLKNEVLYNMDFSDYTKYVLEESNMYYFLINDFFLFSILSIILMYHIIDIKEIKTKFSESFFTSNVYIYLFFILFIVNLLSGIYFHTAFNFQINNNATFVIRLFIITLYFFFFLLLKDYNFKSKKLKRFEFFFLVGCSAFILLILVKCNNFISLIILLEAYSLIAYILVAYKRESLYSTEGGLKYFIIGSFSTGIILLGIFLFYVGSASYNYGDLAMNSLENPFGNPNEVYSRDLEVLIQESPFSFELAKVMNKTGYDNYIYAARKLKYYSKEVIEAENHYRVWSDCVNKMVFMDVINPFLWYHFGPSLKMEEQWGRELHDFEKFFPVLAPEFVSEFDPITKTFVGIKHRFINKEGVFDARRYTRSLRRFISWHPDFRENYYYLEIWARRKVDDEDSDFYKILNFLYYTDGVCNELLFSKFITDLIRKDSWHLTMTNKEDVEALIDYYAQSLETKGKELDVYFDLSLIKENRWDEYIENMYFWDPKFLAKHWYLNWDFSEHTEEQNKWFIMNKSDYYIYGQFREIFEGKFGDLYRGYREWQLNLKENQQICDEKKDFFKALKNLTRHVIHTVPNITDEELHQCVQIAIKEGTLVNYTPYFYDSSKGPLQTVTINGVTMNKEALSWKWLKAYDHNFRMFKSYLKDYVKIKDAIDYSLLGVLFIFVGLWLKLGVAPFHIWIPDVYEGADIWVMAFLTVIPKCVILLLLFSLMNFFNLEFFIGIKILAYISIIASIIVGAFAGLVQSSVQRLLVYSGIANFAFFLGVFVVDNLENSSAFLYYLFFYFILMIPALGCFMSLKNRCDLFIIKNYYNFNNMFCSNKYFSYIIAFLLFCLSGLPPLSFFIAKFYILYTLVHQNIVLVVMIVLGLSSINVVYYIRIIKIIILSRQDDCLFLIDVEHNSASLITSMFLFNMCFVVLPNIIIFFFYDYFLIQ